MRESHFKKDQDKMHAGASFGKSDGPVSNFQNSYDGEKRLSHALTEFGRLFSELKTVGFSKEELQITLLPSPERFAVSIKRKGDARLGFSEISCTESHFSLLIIIIEHLFVCLFITHYQHVSDQGQSGNSTDFTDIQQIC